MVAINPVPVALCKKPLAGMDVHVGSTASVAIVEGLKAQ